MNANVNEIIREMKNPSIKFRYFLKIGQKEDARALAKSAFLFVMVSYYDKVAWLSRIHESFPEEIDAISDDEMLFACLKHYGKMHNIACFMSTEEINEVDWSKIFMRLDAKRNVESIISYNYAQFEAYDKAFAEKAGFDHGLTESQKDYIDSFISQAGREGSRFIWPFNAKKIERKNFFSEKTNLERQNMKNASEMLYEPSYRDMAREFLGQFKHPEAFNPIIKWVIVDSFDCGYPDDAVEVAKEFLPELYDDARELRDILCSE